MPEPANFRQVNFGTFLEDGKITQRKMPNRPDLHSPAECDSFTTPPELYRRRGMLESFGYQPLPRTSITEAARERLGQIGCNDQRIEAIRELTASFRYDGVDFKLLRIEQYPIPTMEYSGGYSVNLPNVIDIKGTLMGQCLDIGEQWLIQAHISNLFSDLPRIPEIGISFGQSPTHFCRPPQNHVWNSLNFFNPLTGNHEQVYVDAAMQLICTPEESKYRTSEEPHIADTITNKLSYSLEGIPIDLHNRVLWSATDRPNWVLGLDPEKNFAYGLCFFVDPNLQGENTRSMFIPGLKRYGVNGNTDFLFTNPVTQEIEWSNPRGKIQNLDEYTLEYLELIQKLQLTEAGEEFLPNMPFDLAIFGSSIQLNTR